MKNNSEGKRLEKIIEMIGSMARLDFSRRLDVEITNDPVDVVAYGLNMLSEELESNVVKRSMLEEINSNLERFSYTAAHDMKSPLNNTMSLLMLIEEELAGVNNPNLHEYFSLLKQINERTRHMITGILEYSRIDINNIKMTEVDMRAICNEIAREYRMRKDIDIHYDESMPVVYHNKVVLEQIISNLASNAIKHNDKDVCKLHIGCTDRDNLYEISVEDNGPGIADKNRQIIFDLFENLKTIKENSTGIGLAIVKKLVTQTNGTIWVESSKEKGARFVFTIEKKGSHFIPRPVL